LAAPTGCADIESLREVDVKSAVVVAPERDDDGDPGLESRDCPPVCDQPLAAVLGIRRSQLPPRSSPAR
jgi:hypothetical protein